MTAKAMALRIGAMVVGMGLLFYLALCGRAVAKAGFGANGSWFNLMRVDRIGIAEEKLPNYFPVFWLCEHCPLFDDIMGSYVSMCYGCMRPESR